MTGAHAPFAREDLVPVHLRDFPVPLAAKAREHSQDQLREFARLAAGSLDGSDPSRGRQIAQRLVDVCSSVAHRFSGSNERAVQAVTDAIESGVDTIDDLVIDMPQEAARALQAFAAVRDDADYFCWDGEDLFAFATPQDCVAFRRWWISQVLDQLDGRHPIRWPESTAARSL